jgi:TPR repeat protein
LGSTKAIFQYENGLDSGYDVPPNVTEAMIWFRKAADFGDMKAIAQYASGLSTGSDDS